jgi:Spy/CpxP family protein refolding chaperone
MRGNWMTGSTGAAVALALVALLGAGTALSKSRDGGCRGHHGKGSYLDRLEAKLDDLGLEAETRAAAAQVVEQARAERETRRDVEREARRALHELLEQEAPAPEQVMAQADAIGALETESHKAKLRTMLELRSLLGAEKWQELQGSLRHRRGEPVDES